MLRTILLAALVCASAPLSADALMDKLFDGKKPKKVAGDWFKGVPTWLNKLEESKRPATTWFKVDERLGFFRIEEATTQSLHAREMVLSGGTDKDGNAVRTPATELTEFTWKQWLPAYMAATYPVESNPSVADVVAFALWLYIEREATVVANSVLTIVHQDKAHVDLRAPIEEFIREQEGLKKDTPLSTFDVWDNDLRAFRKMLIPAEKADRYKKERNEAADACFMDLHNQFIRPETRTLTLPQLAYELRRWALDFGETKSVADNADSQKKLLKQIDEALAKVETYSKAGETYLDDKKPDPEKALAEFNKARELEPYDLRLLSQAANAGFQVAHPTLLGGKHRVVGNESGVPEALALYELWLKREPANVKVMLCIGQLHHLKGETDKAKKHYDAAIKLNLDPSTTKRANDLRRAADENPRNEDKK